MSEVQFKKHRVFRETESDEGSIKIGLTCNDENDLHGIVSQTKEERLLSTNSDLSQD